MTYEEIRTTIITRFSSTYALGYDIIYPGEQPPALEGRSAPLIMLDIEFLTAEQSQISDRDTIKTGWIALGMYIPEYSGLKSKLEVMDFLESISYSTVDGIVYTKAQIAGEAEADGWKLATLTLSFEQHPADFASPAPICAS